MYTNFDEIANSMITPELNEEDFFKLLLSSDSTMVFPVKLLLTQNFDYNLNPKGINDLSFFLENVRIKAQIFLNSVSKLSKEQVKLKSNSITNKYFLDFISFLSTITEEIYSKYINIKRDKNIPESDHKKKFIGYYEKILGDKHGIDFSPTSDAWYYFRSYTLSPSIVESFHTADVKHRLYISIDFDQLINFTRDFIIKMEKLQIPYLLKIKSSKSSGRYVENDTIVIYADSEERVVEYVNAIEEIINNNEKYKNAIHKPSAHLGNIENKIGYGREFARDSSYSSVIGEIGYQALCYALRDISYGIMATKSYTRKEMLKIIEEMKYSKSTQDIYNNFKKRFWHKFNELLEKKGYKIGESICMDSRETSQRIHN